jgi:hypothetical protein
MAKVTLIIHDLEDGAVAMQKHVDRTDDTAQLAEFPATPAMIVGMTFIELFSTGDLEKWFPDVVEKIMKTAGMTPEQMAEAKARAEDALQDD